MALDAEEVVQLPDGIGTREVVNLGAHGGDQGTNGALIGAVKGRLGDGLFWFRPTGKLHIHGGDPTWRKSWAWT